MMNQIESSLQQSCWLSVVDYSSWGACIRHIVTVRRMRLRNGNKKEGQASMKLMNKHSWFNKMKSKHQGKDLMPPTKLKWKIFKNKV
jgi:hypothetical protein